MLANPVKQKLLRDEVSLGVMLMSADLNIVGLTAEAGFDYVMPCLEHTALSLRELEAIVRAADAAGIVPLVRVAGCSKPEILAPLETGVRGIMVPTVESADEARSAADAARYAPFGRRGVWYLGYNSAFGAASPREHLESSNRELLVIVQIETARGLERVREIAEVPGIDCLFVGPGDLSVSLGIPWEFDHPALQDAIRTVFRTARLHGKIAGMMPAGPEHARWCVEEGARLLLAGPDLAFYRSAARAAAADYASALPWTPAG